MPEFWQKQGYLSGREIEAGHWVCVHKMIFTWRLMLCTPDSVQDFYCYHTYAEALVAFVVWDGVKDPPGEWIRHHATGRRRVDGQIVAP
jgi:hypothetical protein